MSRLNEPDLPHLVAADPAGRDVARYSPTANLIRAFAMSIFGESTGTPDGSTPVTSDPSTPQE
jgi:hypothetical protein